jgi:hypothetical protein
MSVMYYCVRACFTFSIILSVIIALFDTRFFFYCQELAVGVFVLCYYGTIDTIDITAHASQFVEKVQASS